jgi:hypothetical protein
LDGQSTDLGQIRDATDDPSELKALAGYESTDDSIVVVRA